MYFGGGRRALPIELQCAGGLLYSSVQLQLELRLQMACPLGQTSACIFQASFLTSLLHCFASCGTPTAELTDGLHHLLMPSLSLPQAQSSTLWCTLLLLPMCLTGAINTA